MRWSDDDIRYFYDMNPDIRISHLAQMPGKTISEVKRILQSVD